jgi:uncharacterized protein YraI
MRYWLSVIVTLLLSLCLFAAAPAAAQTSDCPGAPAAQLEYDSFGQVTPGSPNNLRDQPGSVGKIIGQIPGGGIFYVIYGPVCQDGFNWWNINYNGQQGWTVEGQGNTYFAVPYIPPSVATQTPQGLQAVSGNITFNVDSTLATDVSVATIPANPPVPDTPPWNYAPAYTRFSLVGYPTENRYFRPQLSIFPVVDWETMDPDTTATRINALQTLIRQRSDLNAVTDELPLLPIANAAQVIAVQRGYLNFQDGAGIRFVTHYAQSVDPLTNESIFYTFQGLTGDGAYYVAATFPVTTSALPDTIDYNTFDYNAFSASYQSYMDTTIKTLNDLPTSGFAPGLSKLDALIQSLRVEAPANG